MTLTLPTAPGRLQRLASPLAVGAVAALGTLALHLRDPHQSGSWGYCPTALLGFACPFCGSLRAVNDLTHLDLAAAASSNLLLVMALPLVLVLWGRRLVVLWRGGAAAEPLRVPRAAWIALVAVLVAFTVARNLPAGAWLAP
ncbi:MAG TPA: DUF2752 domain-containing protein [Nocardioides sp.]|nr:DUF2752 domain-containing protein [Nocardioides sp.]